MSFSESVNNVHNENELFQKKKKEDNFKVKMDIRTSTSPWTKI